VVVALPIDEWTAPYETNDFIGGGLTFWDGPKRAEVKTKSSLDDDVSTATPVLTNEIHYDTRSGDIAFIDRYVSKLNLCLLFLCLLMKYCMMHHSLICNHFAFSVWYCQSCLASSRSNNKGYKVCTGNFLQD
jgi:hypothetical protein